MVTIQAFSCFKCGLTPSNGVSVFRMNETGVKGIWACKAHYDNRDPAILTMAADLRAASEMGLTPRQAGEVLGAKVIGE